MVTSSSGSVSHDRDNNVAFQRLLCGARNGETESLGQLLQWYLHYLTILASTQLDQRLRRRVNPSDLIQETMLAAHRDFNDFRGNSQAELLAWLRQILIHSLHRTFATHVKAEKRDVRREVSLDEVSQRVEDSACNLAAVLPGRTVSPSGPMQQREQTVALVNQLSLLRPQYRDVIVYRIVHSLSFEEIAARMNRSSGAVRMLWLRALDAFKQNSELQHDQS